MNVMAILLLVAVLQVYPGTALRSNLLNADDTTAAHFTKVGAFTQEYTFEDYLKVGLEQARQGMDEDALRSAEKALSLKPNSVPALSLCAKLYVKKGNYNRGIETFRQILPFASWTAEDHYYLGYAFYKLRYWVGAQQQLEIAVSLAPDNPAAYVYLGDVYVQTGNPDAGIKMMEKYLKRFPKDPNRAAVEKIVNKLQQ